MHLKVAQAKGSILSTQQSSVFQWIMKTAPPPVRMSQLLLRTGTAETGKATSVSPGRPVMHATYAHREESKKKKKILEHLCL